MLLVRSDVDFDGFVTPVDSWSPCIVSSALILVLRAFPVPSVEASLSTPAASFARICENGIALQHRRKRCVHVCAHGALPWFGR